MANPTGGGYDGYDPAAGTFVPASDGGLPYGNWEREQPAARAAAGSRRPPQPRPRPEQPAVEEVAEFTVLAEEEEAQLEGWVLAAACPWLDAPIGAAGCWLRFAIEPRRSDGAPLVTLVVDWFSRPPGSPVRKLQHDHLERISIERLKRMAKQANGTTKRIAENAVAEYERLASIEYHVVVVEAATDEHARRETKEVYLRPNVGDNALELLRTATGSIDVAGKALRVEKWDGGRRVEVVNGVVGQYDIWLIDKGGNLVDQYGDLSDQPTFSIFARSSQAALATIAAALGQRAFLHNIRKLRVARYEQGSYYQPVEAAIWSFFSDEEWQAFHVRLQNQQRLPGASGSHVVVQLGHKAWAVVEGGFEIAAAILLAIGDAVGRLRGGSNLAAVDERMAQQEAMLAGQATDEMTDDEQVTQPDLGVNIRWARRAALWKGNAGDFGSSTMSNAATASTIRTTTT